MVERIACIDVPALPLQLLLKHQPQWRGQPVAVVDDNSPRGKLLWVNETARRLRILPGMSYAAARTFASQLHTQVVPTHDVQQAIGELFTILHNYSPRVEPNPSRPGVFWLDPTGLGRLYGSLEQWSMAVH